MLRELALIAALTSSGPSPGRAADQAAPLRAAPTDPERAFRTVRFARSVRPEAIQQKSAFDLQGPGATSITMYQPGLIALESGESFTIDPQGEIQPLDRVYRSRVPKAVLQAAAPAFPGGRLISVARVDHRGSGDSPAGDYLGVWRRRQESVVASFEITLNGEVRRPRTLLTTRAPLHAIGYFPALDTPAGGIGLVQRTEGGSVRLLAFGWEHRDWFPRM